MVSVEKVRPESALLRMGWRQSLVVVVLLLSLCCRSADTLQTGDNDRRGSFWAITDSLQRVNNDEESSMSRIAVESLKPNDFDQRSPLWELPIAVEKEEQVLVVCNVKCFRADPVCGEDGTTYWCGAAEAKCAGVEVAYKGFCDASGGAGKDGTRAAQSLLLVHLLWLVLAGFLVIADLL